MLNKSNWLRTYLNFLISIIPCWALVFVSINFVKAQPGNRKIDSLKGLLAKEKNDSLLIGLNIEIGKEYEGAKHDSALIYYQAALGISKEHKNRSRQLRINERIAHLYLEVGNFPDALQLSLDNLKMAEELHDTDAIFFAKREMVFVYSQIGDFSKALGLAKEMEVIATSGFGNSSKRNRLLQLMVYHNMANTYESMNHLDSASRYRRLVYYFATRAKDTEGLALSAIALAELHDKLGRTDSAFYYDRLAFFYGKKAHRFDIATESKKHIASLFEKTGQLDSALYFSYQYYNESKSRMDTAGLMEGALLLSKVYKDRKQFDSAYSYLAYHNQLKDLLKTEDKIQKVQSLGFNELMRKTQLEQAKREYRAKVKIYILLIGLGLIVVFSFFLLRSNSQKHKAKLEVEKAYSELKSTQAQLIHSEKMASLGELTAGIAHEIQNPLNFVKNFSEVSNELLDEMKLDLATGDKQQAIEIADVVKQNLEKVIYHGKRADGIVKGMLMHSRTSIGQKELTDINVLVDEYLRLSYHGLRAKDKSFQVKFETHFDETIEKISVIPQDIGRVLLNLFTNAFYSVTEKNKHHPDNYEPLVSVSTKKLKDKVEVKVKDNGMGVPQKLMARIFQPFFTTKPTGEGTGLGLSLSYDIITKGHGGELKLDTEEGEFAEFIILLPVQ